jgi:hypothetical protein
MTMARPRRSQTPAAPARSDGQRRQRHGWHRRHGRITRDRSTARVWGGAPDRAGAGGAAVEIPPIGLALRTKSGDLRGKHRPLPQPGQARHDRLPVPYRSWLVQLVVGCSHPPTTGHALSPSLPCGPIDVVRAVGIVDTASIDTASIVATLTRSGQHRRRVTAGRQRTRSVLLLASTSMPPSPAGAEMI